MELNIKRNIEGMAPLDIECLLILNDAEVGTIEILKSNVEPVIAAISGEVPKLHLRALYFEKPFEVLYPEIKALLQGRYQNVLFNLDQYGHSDVRLSTLLDIGQSFSSAEIFYTFAISSLLAFLQKSNPTALLRQLGFLGVTEANLSPLEGQMSKNEWLGAAELLVFDYFHGSAQFVSPFSINNPAGWRYWLIHLANKNYRARQEYNNVLHNNSTMQAHFGRSGLEMLSYDPSHEGSLYLFDIADRAQAKQQLLEDIPRLIARCGDAVTVGEFYGDIYNKTPAHMDDIHEAMVDNPDVEVVIEGGGVRRSPNTIKPDDTLRLKRQLTFFPRFLRKNDYE